MREFSWLALVCIALLSLGCDPDDDVADDDVTDDDDDTGDDDDVADDDAAEPELTGVRHLLLEEFTNTSCGPCASQNPSIDAFLEGVGAGNVTAIKVHTDFPGEDDPFFLADPVEHQARRDYYGVSSVPTVIIDGVHELSWHGGNYYSDVSGLFAPPLQADVAVALNGSGGSYTAAVQVVGTDELAAPRLATLRVAAVLRYTQYSTAPGSNDETEFHDPALRLLPDAAGTAVTVEAGSDETFTFPFELTLDDPWAEEELQVVAFLQDDATLEILQAATTEQPPAHSFRLVETEPEGVMLEVDETRDYRVWLENSSAFADVYDISLLGDVPAGWTVSWTIEGEVVDGVEAEIPVDEGAAVEMVIHVDPAGVSGWVPLVIHVEPDCANEPMQEVTLTTLTYGAPVLLVDADGGDDFESYYQGALDAHGADFVVWRSETDLPSVDLARFDAVVWNAGWFFPHFYADEQAALGAYLDDGGKLFISGMDIGWDQCDEASWYTESSEWYETYLHAQYMADDAALTAVEGVTGGLLDGLDFDITGGTGADNQDYPSWIEPLGPGDELVLQYSDGSGAAVRGDHGSNGGKVVYMAFGFEAIAAGADRAELLSRVLGWFAE